MLPVSLDCLFLIFHSVFFNVYVLHTVVMVRRHGHNEMYFNLYHRFFFPILLINKITIAIDCYLHICFLMLPFTGWGLMTVVGGDVLIISWELVDIVLRSVSSCIVFVLVVAVKESLKF